MGTTQDVKDRMPGLRFRLSSKRSSSTPTLSGTFHGNIELACEFTDKKLFDAAAEKLDGFKMFSELAEEMVDALGEELDNTAQTLLQAQQEIVVLKESCAEKDAEIERLRGLLQVIDVDLADAKGEAVFNDRD